MSGRGLSGEPRSDSFGPNREPSGTRGGPPRVGFSVSKEELADAALFVSCAALAHVAVIDILPVHDVYEIETREPSESWFYARACGLEAANEELLEATKPGTRFVVSDRFYEKDAECWAIRMAGSTEWIEVFVKSDHARPVR